MNRLVLVLLVLTVALSSCTLATGTQTLNPTDMALFQKSFMSSYYAERDGSPGGYVRGITALTPFVKTESAVQSRATVPVGQLATRSLPTTFAALLAAPADSMTLTNYPEPGQTSVFAVSTQDAGNEVYKISVKTTYPSTDARASYLEEYYVQDSADAGDWTINDPVVAWSGSAWSQDQASRVKMLLTFRDGSTRTETIVASSTPTSSVSCPVFDPAAFAVGGSLDLTQAFVPAEFTDTGTRKGMYSSVVMYYVTPAKSYNFWFWTGTSAQTILGVRYYTEIVDTLANTYTSHTASFEKTVDTMTTTGGSFSTTLATITAGSSFTTLAESVLRQQVIYTLAGSGTELDPYLPSGTGALTTNMQTRVVNITGKKDFYLTQLNGDRVQLGSWQDTTVYIPTGSDDEILAVDPAAGVFTRNQQAQPATGTLPYAISTTDSIGWGDTATVYGSITAGTALSSITVPSTVSSNSSLMGTSTEYQFGGQNAIGVTTGSTINLGSAGTVEAWIYINKYTNTAGIVHKGEAADWSDECFSLQGWDSSGTFAIILDKPGSGNTYDKVTTKNKLNQGKWYYLAATWDTSTKKINLYVNGALSSAGNMANTSGGVRTNSSGILVGSQLPSIYSTSYGYFGFNGKIVGANTRSYAMSASQVQDQYNAVSPYTSSW